MSQNNSKPSTGAELFTAWWFFHRWDAQARKMVYMDQEHTVTAVHRRHVPVALVAMLCMVLLGTFTWEPLPTFSLLASATLSAVITCAIFARMTARKD